MVALPLPVEDQNRVVVLWGEADRSIRRLPLGYEHFERFREAPRTLQEVAGVLSPRGWPHAIRHGEQGLSLNLAAVTGNFFPVLGTRPVIGRLLKADDDVVGAPRVMVISYSLWRRQFGGDPGVLGQTLTLHERDLAYTVVGVAPPGLEYPAAADFWIPLRPFAELEAVPVARLAPASTPAQAAAELRTSFERDASVTWRDLRAVAMPLPDVIFGEVRPALQLLCAAAALILLIGCFNVANLLLARASTRLHELAVRRALGARQERIVRQLLTESCLLAVAGGVLGTLLAGALVNVLLFVAPPELPRLEEIRLGSAALGWAVAVSLAAALLFGVVPAWLASRSVASPIGASDRSGSESWAGRRFQNGLVVLQIGLALVVLAAAGVLGRSLVQLQRIDLGFAENVAIVELVSPHARFETPDAGASSAGAFFDRVVPRIEGLPGVLSASLMHLLPFEGAAGGIDGRLVAEGTERMDAATAPMFSIEVVGPGYFDTLGIPLLRGRAFSNADRKESPRVMIVTQAVARMLWPGGDAVGRRLGFGQPERVEDWWTVVGVVADTRFREMREMTPTVYVPAGQFMGVNRLAIRTIGDPADVLPSVRQAVQEMDPQTLVASAHTMKGLVAKELARPRLNATLIGAFALGALVLSGVGLYGTLAYVVGRRARELAIRHALGASPSRLRSLVFGQALVLASAGTVLGLAGAIAGGGLLDSMLFATSATDPLTLAGVATLVLTVALAASYLPARTAMRADPAAVLRRE
jgi:putative ABC transport system permease protein